MPPGPTRLFKFLRTLLAAMLVAGSAHVHADEYAEVKQLLQSGQPAQALARADTYLADKPRDPQMRFLRGVILSETGQAAEAEAVFTRLTQDYPELPEPYNNLAVLYAQQNDLHKARAALEMAVRNNPSYATAHENLGDIHLRLAVQSYERAAQLAPANAAIGPKLARARELLAPPGPAARATPPAGNR